MSKRAFQSVSFRLSLCARRSENKSRRKPSCRFRRPLIHSRKRSGSQTEGGGTIMNFYHRCPRYGSDEDGRYKTSGFRALLKTIPK